jgi:inner membrane protein
VRNRFRQRFWLQNGDPSPFGWIVASISLVLPVVGLVLCLLGGIRAFSGDDGGWTWLGVGAAAIVLDILIDFAWAHPGVSASDQPHLNRRTDQLSGRKAIVTDAISGGRGKVRVGDTVWAAEGPDSPAGTVVRITAANATVLRVEIDPTGER